jgi:hypothetical protein
MMPLTPAERRERAHLRSLRWRRAHGIGPRKPAQTPWLAMGISRSPNYRRRAKARERAALAHAAAVLERLQWQVAELRTHCDRLAAANAIMAVELSRPVPLVW